MEAQALILTKSFELFKRYGIRSITMDEIALHCGMSKKTVYLHFTDKDTLISTIMQDNLHTAEAFCEKAVAESDNAIHEIFLSMDWILDMYEGLNPAMIFDLRKYHCAVFRRFEEHKHTFLKNNVQKNFERGMKEKIYRHDIKIDIMVPYRLHMMTLVFDLDLFPKSKYSLPEIDREIMTHLLYGVATQQGMQLIEKYKTERLPTQ